MGAHTFKHQITKDQQNLWFQSWEIHKHGENPRKSDTCDWPIHRWCGDQSPSKIFLAPRAMCLDQWCPPLDGSGVVFLQLLVNLANVCTTPNRWYSRWLKTVQTYPNLEEFTYTYFTKAIGSTIPNYLPLWWVGFQPSIHMGGLWHCFTKQHLLNVVGAYHLKALLLSSSNRGGTHH
jgi:hypothetical protein